VKVFAVDLGAKLTGWAVLSGTLPPGRELLSVGTWHLEPKGRTQTPGVRWLRLRTYLDQVLDVSRIAPDLVAYEEVRNHTSRAAGGRPTFNVSAAHAYGAAEGVLLAWAAARGLEVLSVPVADIKRAALGKGGGKGTGKAEVLAAARERWPFHRFETDDAADAAWIGVAAVTMFNRGG
jgi:Holliday junction resolvasome RuvABC endonuclease subunit